MTRRGPERRRAVLRDHRGRGDHQPRGGDAFHPRAAQRGCRFALDDFGSGLSSFIYLKNLPVDFLKIDGQFVHNVTHDRIDRSMVEAIAQIGDTMGIRTIAERVDSAEVLARLADIGIQYAQGHYIGEPQPVEILDALLKADPADFRLTA